jgi:hypothetical protein
MGSGGVGFVITNTDDGSIPFKAYGSGALTNSRQHDVGGALRVVGPVTNMAQTVVQGILVTNGVSTATRLLAGVGGFATNKVLVSTNGHCYINGGLTNNFFSHVIGSPAGTIDWFTFTMTNVSGSDKPMGWSYVTNNWNFIWSGGTNPPTVMTNNTAWECSGYKDGSNVVLGLASRKCP